MPTKPVNAHQYAAATRVTDNLIGIAWGQVQDAVSCVSVGLDSDRAEVLESLCEELLVSAMANIRLAMSLAVLSAESMPESAHDEAGPGRDPNQG